MNRRIVPFATTAILLISALTLFSVAQGEPITQDATLQQQTVDALVQQRFTQTAAAQQQVSQTQVAVTQTAAAEPPSPPTQTAAFEATINAAFYQAMTATVQVEIQATLQARGLEIITPDNLARLEQLGNLDESIRDAIRLAFGPGGRLLVTGSLRGSVRLWDATSGAELRRFSGHNDDITALAFNSDGRLIASASKDGNVRVWDATTGGEVLTLPIGVVHSLAFSPDGTRLATGDQNGTVYLWDTLTGTQVQTFNVQLGAVRTIAFHPNNRLIALGGDTSSVQVWDINGPTLIADLVYSPNVTTVAYSPDGQWLVAASRNAPLWQWDANSGVQVWGKTAVATIDSFAFSPDGRLIASVTHENETLAIWDAATGALLTNFKMGNPVVNVAFSPDGAGIAIAAGTVRLWGVVSGSTAPTTGGGDQTTEPSLPTLTPRPGATPRPEGFPTDTLAEVQIVEQVFEHGRMFWIRHNRQIWVMAENPTVPQGGDWYCYNDTFEEGTPETDPSLVAPDDLIQPKRGFGKLWREQPGLKDALGWALTPEFDLISYYTYLAGGYMQDGAYVPGPGEHRLTTLYGDSLSFFEREIRGDCLGGTWQITGE